MHICTSDQDKLDLGFWDCSCNWGTHIAGLYETDKERDEIILGFLETGMRLGDLQLYCPCECTKDDFVERYSTRHPDSAKAVFDEDQLRFLSTKNLYYPDGTFDPCAMDRGLNEFYEESQKNGRRNIRVTAEMVWALEAIPGVEQLMAYESRLNYFIPGKPWVSICMYNVTKFDGKTIMKVLQTHPYTLSGGVITRNPYYQNPDEWLAENAPEFLECDN